MGSFIAARIFDLWRMGHATWCQDPFDIILHGILSPGGSVFFQTPWDQDGFSIAEYIQFIILPYHHRRIHCIIFAFSQML